MTPEEKEKRVRASETAVRINAKDAEIGKTYLVAGMLYKATIIKKNGMEFGATSVTINSESSPNYPLNISGGTELIPYTEDLYIPPTVSATESNVDKKDKTTSKGETPMKEKQPKEKGTPHTKMSDVITPMLLEGKTAEEIADKVIAASPDKEGDRANLIRQIKGPRRYNLIKKLEKEGKEVPAFLKDKPKKAAQA